LTVTSLNFAPRLAAALEAPHGKFTLTPDVHFGFAKVPAGEYEFSFNPDGPVHMLSLSKISGPRAGFLVLVPATSDAKPTDASRLLLESTPAGSYVSSMQLPEFGMTLYFAVPPHATERQIATAATTATAAAQ